MHYTDEIAAQYASNRDKYTSTDAEVFERVSRVGVSGKDVLDLGCGDGVYTFKFKELGAATVLGVDISEAMIALAQKRPQENGVSFSVGAMENIPTPDASFDFIFSNFALHYCPDVAIVFKEMHRVLRSSSSAVVVFNVSETTNKALQNTWMPLSIGGLITVETRIKSHEEIKDGIMSSGLTLLEYAFVDSSYLSIGKGYAHHADINKIQNVVAVLRKD